MGTVLGPLLITRDGLPIALQPKRAALFVYLALDERAGLQRRDMLRGGLPRRVEIHFDILPLPLAKPHNAENAPRHVSEENRQPDVSRVKSAHRLDDRTHA